jgi:protein-disulfide isomerase
MVFMGFSVVWLMESVTQASSSSFTQEQVHEIQTIVQDYLKNTPEVLEEALKALHQHQHTQRLEQTRKMIADNQHALLQNTGDAILGNAHGSVSLVVFADPYCGHCRRFQAVVEQVVKENPNLTVIFKDLPIFGEASVNAVKALKAAHQQGKYWEMLALIHQQHRPPSLTQLKALAKRIKGLNMQSFNQALQDDKTEQYIQATVTLAEKLGIEGTPALIVGEQLIPGALSIESLRTVLNQSAPPSVGVHQPVSDQQR